MQINGVCAWPMAHGWQDNHSAPHFDNEALTRTPMVGMQTPINVMATPMIGQSTPMHTPLHDGKHDG